MNASTSRTWTAAVAVAAATTAVNVGIHAALTPMHLEEMPYIGVLFILGNVAVVASFILIVIRRTRLLGWALAAATSAAEIGAFLASRTIGLPHGYKETWSLATENVLGYVCVVVEAVTITVALAQLLRARAASGNVAQPIPSMALGARS